MATNVTILFETKQLKPFIELSSVQETWAWKICHIGQRNVATHAKNMPAELSKEKHESEHYWAALKCNYI